MTMLKSKQHIILETVIYYGQDISRRSVSEKGCVYNHEDGKTHCAFARCVKPKMRGLLIEESLASWSIHHWGKDTQLMMEEYRGRSPAFWNSVQAIHDFPSNWDFMSGRGLTPSGIKMVKDTLLEHEI